MVRFVFLENYLEFRVENRLKWSIVGGWEKDYGVCGNFFGRDGGNSNEGVGENLKE